MEGNVRDGNTKYKRRRKVKEGKKSKRGVEKVEVQVGKKVRGRKEKVTERKKK